VQPFGETSEDVSLKYPGRSGFETGTPGPLGPGPSRVRAGRGAPGPLFLCAETSENAVNAKFAEGLLQHQLALGRLDELDFGCSGPVRSVFVALSCLDTLWQEVSSRAIYVSDAVGHLLGNPPLRSATRGCLLLLRL
jgi:hypothetical protein